MGAGPVTASAAIRRRDVPEAFYDALPAHLSPLLRRVYAARRVAPGEVAATLGGLLPVGTLGGAAEAGAFLADVRERRRPLLVIGDYDADGATATALMVGVLRAMGFAGVSYLVPNRFEFGYGLSPAIVELAAARGAEVLVTVDNGITSLDGVARAHALGLEVLITDHHLPGPELPAARVIVNPHQPGEAFASRALCGVGVAFYVMAALARELARRGVAPYESLQQALTARLDLVALGTVADLVALDANNRVLVAEGLRRIRAGRASAGVTALFRVAGRERRDACSADLGFAVAPRLNAAGRLTDMSLGIECLLAQDLAQALELAGRLDTLNAERQELQRQMQAQAEARLPEALPAGDEGAPALCLYDPGWHEGIVGLVASRMKERTGRPVIAFAPGGDLGTLKGSARSVEGVHIRDVLAAMVARSPLPGMSFGGHAMAAGVRLPESQLAAFRQAFAAEVGRQLSPLESARVLWTDGPLASGDLSVALAEEMRFAGPWGQGFPEPLFDNVLDVLGQRVLKDAHLRLSLRHPDGGEPLEAIAFNETRTLPARARFLYRLGINDFGGTRRRQLVVEHIRCD